VDGKVKFLGGFSNPEDASKAVEKYIAEHGEPKPRGRPKGEPKPRNPKKRKKKKAAKVHGKSHTPPAPVEPAPAPIVVPRFDAAARLAMIKRLSGFKG
jgi:hypothetical protein